MPPPKGAPGFRGDEDSGVLLQDVCVDSMSAGFRLTLIMFLLKETGNERSSRHFESLVRISVCREEESLHILQHIGGRKL
jgi:hypothetical protein